MENKKSIRCECGRTAIHKGKDCEELDFWKCPKCGTVYYNEGEL